MIPLVDVNAELRSIRREVDLAIKRVLEDGSFILGPDVQRFEEEFAAFCESCFAVGVDSGISALELGMRSLGIGPGDEVIVPANSFIASGSAVSFTGATPVFADVDRHTYNLDPSDVKRRITPRTKAIMPVHLYGRPADMNAITVIAEDHGLLIIEDACQAHGARYEGRRVGTLGHVAAFSFYPAKNLGALGDGGALVTNDPDVAATVGKMRNYGQSEKYRHEYLAWNRRLDTLQAAVLRVKLRHLESWNANRRRLAELYAELLSDGEIPRLRVPDSGDGTEHVYHLLVVETERRDELRDFLAGRGIETGVHYPVPIPLQPAYAHLGHRPGDFPRAEEAARRLVSLPLFPTMPEGMVEEVASSIRSFYKNKGGVEWTSLEARHS